MSKITDLSKLRNVFIEIKEEEDVVESQLINSILEYVDKTECAGRRSTDKKINRLCMILVVQSIFLAALTIVLMNK